MRITNNAIVRNYNYNLNSSLARLNQYSNRITTERKFTSMSEDTASGVRAMGLRRSLDRAASYLDTAQTVHSQLTAAEGQMMQVGEIAKTVRERYTLALNDTNNSVDREVFATEIEALMKQIITCANGQFSGRFQFGGTNTTSAPFAVTYDPNDPKKIIGLTYNGVDVANMTDSNGNVYPEYQYLFDDAVYVDIGLGLTTDENGALVTSSAFKSSLNGLDFLGAGENNLFLVCNEIVNALRNPEFTNQGYFQDLLERLITSTSDLTIAVTNLGADYNYLDQTMERLADDMLNMYDRQDQIEFVDPAEAIMEWKMQEYVYSAALQMGQRLLQPTLFNYIS